MEDLGFRPDGKKLFFDISGIVAYVEKIDRYSGIQRVVAELISAYAQLVGSDNLYLTWGERASGKFQCIPFDAVGDDVIVDPAAMRALFFPGTQGLFQPAPLRKYKPRSAKYYFHRARLDAASVLGRDAAFKRYDMTAKRWKSERKSARPAVKKHHELQGRPVAEVASAGDYLILLDSSWEAHHIKWFTGCKELGMEVHTLIYDLIPILVPHCNVRVMTTVFYDYLLNSAEYTTHYMTISEATKRDLDGFFATHGIDRSVRAVPLTQTSLDPRKTFDQHPELNGPVTSRIDYEAYPHLADSYLLEEKMRYLVSNSYALCVGTIEPRKNALRLLLAWKYLLDQGHTDIPQLVFAGRRGWLLEDFDRLMAETGNLYSYVHVIEGPSDQTLDILYRNADFTLMPSIYEGWGLPVGEALAYGKTAVVGENSSLVEVGQDMVEYCDAGSVKSIAEAVLRLTNPERRQELEQKIADTTLRNWTDVARDMGRAIYRNE